MGLKNECVRVSKMACSVVQSDLIVGYYLETVNLIYKKNEFMEKFIRAIFQTSRQFIEL
jgi:hypothetical protein